MSARVPSATTRNRPQGGKEVMKSAKTLGPDYRQLFGLFPYSDDLPQIEFIPAHEMPEPYHALLVHEHHMTVTVEAHHQSRVDVRILERVREGNSYARKILLTSQRTGEVVQFGIVRIWLQYCSPEVQRRILEGKTPLGRILIENDVLRRIEPTAFLRVLPGRALDTWFGDKGRQPAYGRLAYIHCNDQPAIELMEVVVPE
jgi:chorismate-pyruvate lyase